MPPTYDVLIIGGGHNGLVTAFYLGRAGLRPLVLERRDQVGGAVVTEELAPGFRCPALAHVAGPLGEAVARDLQLERYGLELFSIEPSLVALGRDGESVAFFTDPRRTAESVARLSPGDAARYPDFHRALARLGRQLVPLAALTPPDVDRIGPRDLWGLLGTARRFRALDRGDRVRLLRWMPMPVADLVGEWFEHDLVSAALAARALVGTFFGPRSPGTGGVLLQRAAADPSPAGRAVFARGGPGALTRAIADAARQAGAEIRTGAAVVRIQVRDEHVEGVVLSSGEAMAATIVVSSADPKHTLLGLVDPPDLNPEFAWRVRNYRCRGTLAKVNLALDGLPEVSALAGASHPAQALGGRLHIGPDLDYLERAFDAAKYGRVAAEPWLEVAIPSLYDPSLAPAGRHVMSIYAHCAPFELHDGHWPSEREALGDVVVRPLAPDAPGVAPRVLHRQVITPQDLEARYGLTGGDIFHGEPALDQMFAARPLLGWARYRTPIAGLYLCGAGTHPGGGITGGPGANASREILTDLRHRRSQP